jgi:hypothetical protein
MRCFEVYPGAVSVPAAPPAAKFGHRVLAPRDHADTSFHIRIDRLKDTTADSGISCGIAAIAPQSPEEGN